MIRRASPAARRRAAVLVLVAVALAVTCTFLGRWQWHRHVARDARIAVVQANWAAAPVPLASLATVDDEPAAADEWRSVTVAGEYLPDATVLLRNRPVEGVPAYHVLVPFLVPATDPDEPAEPGELVEPGVPRGAMLVVDRGWIRVGDDGSTAPQVPVPPAGTVDLVVRLRLPEPTSDRSAPAGQVQAVDIGQVLAAGYLAPVGHPASDPSAYRWYAGLVSESPAPATPLGALSAPSTDPGSHLSYAFQWWAFALGGLAAFTWMARRELLEDAATRAGSPSPATTGPPPSATTSPPVGTRPPRPRRRRGRDEEAEDALIDAQVRERS